MSCLVSFDGSRRIFAFSGTAFLPFPANYAPGGTGPRPNLDWNVSDWTGARCCWKDRFVVVMAPKPAAGAKKETGAAGAAQTASALKKRPLVVKKKIRTAVRFRRPKTLAIPRNPKCPQRSVPRLPRMHQYRVIKSPLTSEVVMRKIEETNTLVFLCDPRANNSQIKEAVKGLYSLKARSINTLIRPDGVKKAFVRLVPEFDALDVANKIGIL